MNVLVIGSGGREHALAWKLSRSPATHAVYTAPGNYGTNLLGPNVNISAADPESLADWAEENKIDLTVVGPESSLALGVVDVFRARKLRIFGPTRAAAQLETSKAFAKAFMVRHGIPTAPYKEFADLTEVEHYLRRLRDDEYPIVVKADGLAGGKGVTIANDRHVAIGAARLALEQRGREPAQRVTVESFLSGYEVSFMAISDGETVIPLAPARDYKRAYDGDAGPMTGGMGSYSPVSTMTDDLCEQVMTTIVRPTVEGMAADGVPFQGVLYAGLMITRAGPQVLEFNVRFGDPETQVVLPRLDTDLYIVLDAAIDGDLGSIRPLTWNRDAACGVVVASEGYPGEVETGYGIIGLGDTGSSSWIFHSGTRNPFVRTESLVTPKAPRPMRGAFGGRSFFSMVLPSRAGGQVADRQAAMMSRGRENQVITSGGRVLTVVSRGRTVDDARTAAYQLRETVTFTGCWSRTDIAADDASLGK